MKHLLCSLLTLIATASYAQSVIFTQQVNNNDNLMLCDERGNISTLTNHRRKDSSPMVSPDGTKVVFTSERVGWWKIWIMDIDGKNVKQLTNNSSADYSPSWSPNGKTIVYTCTKDGNQEIYLMNPDGSNKRNITNTRGDEVMPSWAKDGFIYFSATVGNHYQIMRCKPDGTGRETITSGTGDKLMAQPSPNGESILYYGNQDGNMEIYLYDVASKTSKRLTNHSLMDIRPRWSVDGEKIVFERGNKGDNHHIFIMNRDGSNLKKLTNKNYNYTPSFITNQ